MTGRGIPAGQAGQERSRGSRAVGIVLVMVFVCQFAMLGYLNMTQLRNHLGFDSSWDYLRTALVWQEKTLTNPAWRESTSLCLDTHYLLCSLLYGLTGDIMLAFGIGNTVLVCALLLFMWRILSRLGVGFGAKMIALNLVICPYLTNGFFPYMDLGYFSMVLSGAPQYGLRVLLVLMMIDEYLIILQREKFGILAWIIWALCVLSGFSSGVYIMVVMLLPCLVYEIEMFALRDDWRQFLRKDSVFVYLCCACVMAGKKLAEVFAGYVAMDNSTSWTSIEALWSNFGAVIQGFLKLLQVLPVTGNVDSIVSKTGLLRMFILLVFALIVLSVVSFLRRTMKDKTEQGGAMLFLSNLLGMNFLIFGLYNARYGAEIFEERYLLTFFFVAMIMTAVFFDRLKGKRALSLALSLAMACSILAVDVHSDYNYLRTTNDSWDLDEIQALAEEQDAGIVYFWGSDLKAIGRTMRACDLNRIYKNVLDTGDYFHFDGDYTTLDRFEDYSGTTMLICNREDHLVPEGVLAEYTLVDTLDYALLGRTGQLDVYVSDHNPPLF